MTLSRHIIYSEMINIKATISGKQKRTEVLDVANRDDLVKKIEVTFNVDPTSIVFMKPPLGVTSSLTQTQELFLKNVKAGIEILFRANEKK